MDTTRRMFRTCWSTLSIYKALPEVRHAQTRTETRRGKVGRGRPLPPCLPIAFCLPPFPFAFPFPVSFSPLRTHLASFSSHLISHILSYNLIISCPCFLTPSIKVSNLLYVQLPTALSQGKLFARTFTLLATPSYSPRVKLLSRTWRLVRLE